MPAQAHRLSDRQLKAVKATGKDFVLTDGDGLQLRVRASGSMIWNFNYREPVTKNRLNMALGPYPALSLANARKKAQEARELLAQGIDPKAHRDELSDCPTPQRNHGLRRQLRTDLCQPTQRHSGRLQKTAKAKHGGTCSRRTARAHGGDSQRQH